MISPRLAIALFSVAAVAQQPEFVRIPGRDFRMGKTEVTVGQFAAFVKATGYQTAAERENAPRTWKTPGFKTEKDQPVVYVSPNDASAYCGWIGARVPTDAEWEYAAGAGATTRHYWGEKIDGRYLWYRANSEDRPRAVGTKRPNAWGLYDVEGNVWEWAASPPVKGEALANRRGGSWVTCENRENAPPEPPSPLIGLSKSYKVPVKNEHRYDDIGFRCVR